MNRTDLAKHIRAKLEPLAEELADLLLTRIETQIADVLDVARSALLSDLVLPSEPPTFDVIKALTGIDTAAGGREPRIFPAARPAKVAVTAKESARPHAPKRREPGENIPAPPPAIRTPHNKGKQIVCTVCHELGHNARRHKGELPAIATDSTEDEHHARRGAPTPAPAPFLSKRDRFAAIEESAAKRTGSLPTPRATFHFPGGAQ